MNAALLLSAGLAAASLAAPAGGFRDPFLDGGRGPEMVGIPAGSFLMGSEPGSPGFLPFSVPHPVELAAFAIGRTEVTNEEYARFLNEVGNDDGGVPFVEPAEDGIRRQDGVFRPAPGSERRPVVSVSWRGALAFCRWLTAKTGFAYSLPTEAQWERTARAGSAAAWPWGETFEGGRLACAGTTAGPVPVASFAADANGIHDMLGNVWEWTLDCFALDFYFYAPRHDPRLLDPECLAPGIRGGSFQDPPELCSPGYRINFWWRGAPSIGFRVARDVERADRVFLPSMPVDRSQRAWRAIP